MKKFTSYPIEASLKKAVPFIVHRSFHFFFVFAEIEDFENLHVVANSGFIPISQTNGSSWL